MCFELYNYLVSFVKIRWVYLHHTHLAVQPSEWEEPSACLMESGWSFSASERGRARTGAGRERFPLSLENCPRCSAVSEPVPPNQTVLMTHDPGTWALGAHLCHFKTPQTHHYTVHLFASHSHTYTPHSVNPRCSPVWLLVLEQCAGWFQSSGRWQ